MERSSAESRRPVAGRGWGWCGRRAIAGRETALRELERWRKSKSSKRVLDLDRAVDARCTARRWRLTFAPELVRSFAGGHEGLGGAWIVGLDWMECES
jgi:hypothetical protein